AGKPGLCVGPGNAPIYIHKTADVRGAVVDMLISKTFDASVICPAEQTCVVDDQAYDELLAEFERMGAQGLTDAEVAPVGQSCLSLGGMAGFNVRPDAKILLAPLPSDLDALATHPLLQEKLMP